MASPSPYQANSTQLESKFGHHDSSFGTLADYTDFHQMMDRVGGFDGLIKIDLTESLGLLYAQPDAQLAVKVPTLSFTDPAFDFDLRPWFATPLSLNGFGASKAHPELSRPVKMIATDIMGNEYPVLFNEKGHIDYDLIAKQVDGPLYTTLKFITFVYSAEQVLMGRDMTKLPMVSEHHGQLLLMPPQATQKGFEIEMQVLLEQGVVHHEIIEYQHQVPDLYHIHQMDIQTNQGDAGLQLQIEVDASAYQTLLPHQMGISLQLPQMTVKDNIVQHLEIDLLEPLELTQYFGLSQGMLSSVLDVLIPQEKMASAFKDSNANPWNDFTYPEAMQSFYTEMKQGIIDNAIPLEALSDFYAASDDIKAQMRALSIEAMTKPDHEVFTDLVQKMYQGGDISSQLADQIDHMLSIEPLYPHALFVLDTNLKELPDDLDLNLSLTPFGSQFGKQTYKLTPDGLIDIELYTPPSLIEDPTIEDPYFGESSLEQAQTVGQRFSITSENIIDGAAVIHDFDWHNHDVIDLGPLLSQLGGSILEPSISSEVHGDELEIYLEDSSGLGGNEKLHVATIVGVGSDDDMPSIDQFVEFPS